MRVRVRLFAGLRERAGWGELEVEASSVADVWPALELGDEPEGLLYAVNHEYADREPARLWRRVPPRPRGARSV